MRWASVAVLLAFSLATFGVTAPTSFGSADATRYVFSSPKREVSVPFELMDNEPVLRVQLGDSKESLSFVLDSCSKASYVDTAVADRLGLKTSGSGTVHGAGAGSIPVKYIDNVTLNIQGLRSLGHRVNTVDLSGVSGSSGRRIEGILGNDFISRFVVTVDYEKLRITITDAAAFSYSGGGAVLPVKLQNGWPYIPGTVAVAGAPVSEVELLVDSGSGDSVDDPIILKSAAETRKIRTGVGLGKPTEGVIGRGLYLQLGKYRLEGPMVACCGTNPGDMHKIGGEVLRRFTVIFDYSRQRMILLPNPHFAELFPNA